MCKDFCIAAEKIKFKSTINDYLNAKALRKMKSATKVNVLSESFREKNDEKLILYTKRRAN